MKANQTLKGTDGYQVCLYPLPILYLTQLSGSNSFSHCCGNPIDAVGSTAQATLYAPCDCTLYYQGALSDGNSCSFVSNDKVHTPAGLTKVSFQFTHGTLLGNGKTYSQGDPIYTTGTYGQATGDHVHIDQSLFANAIMTSYGITCSYGNECWALYGSYSPEKFWYVNGTTISSTLGLSFKEYSGGVEGESVLNWIIPETTQPLSEDDMKNNAKCFYGYMNVKYGWTLNAVCGMLGNIQSESTINPNRWQGDTEYAEPVSSMGFGLVQWTPWTNIVNWLKEKNYWGTVSTYGNAECDKIQEEYETGGQWIETTAYPMTFEQFKNSTQTPSYLAMVFLMNYERPYDPDQPIRGTQAQAWYEYLKDWEPVIPGTAEKTKKKKRKHMPIWMMINPWI